MRPASATGTAAILLLLGTVLPAHSQGRQDEGRGKPDKRDGGQKQAERARPQQNRPQREAQPPRAARPEAQREQPQRREPQARPPAQRAQRPPQRPEQARPMPAPQRQPMARGPQGPSRPRQEAMDWQRQRGWMRNGGWNGISTWQQGRARNWESEHRTWVQRGGYGGAYIPQARFSLYFGPQHWFRIHTRPVLYMGYPRFAYRGFTFLLVDPWPEYWTDDWYATDDVFVDYDDGYYLVNRRRPGVRLALTVVL